MNKEKRATTVKKYLGGGEFVEALDFWDLDIGDCYELYSHGELCGRGEFGKWRERKHKDGSWHYAGYISGKIERRIIDAIQSDITIPVSVAELEFLNRIVT